MFDFATLAAYLAAAAVLVLIPGPGTAWIIAQSAAGGTSRGVQAAFGLETATLIHALAAGLGLSALLATSALAFEAIKYAGAAYLIWLGIKAWRSPSPVPAATDDASQAAATSARHVYLRSVMTGVLNPKVALFFLAFLPQFVHPERGMVWLQFLVLGALLSLIGLSHSVLLSVAFGHFGRRIGRRFSGGGRWKERLTGSVFIALGLRLAVQQRS
ncbi:LysE family translocator [Lysobacter antibioticus]|uniref:LysE family translocator n=1 Tax=Lysobacter antibioticus TaxID=84531 RepID=UPI0004D01B83|nr:LysE family translocator [Lysobacter antibioticus]